MSRAGVAVLIVAGALAFAGSARAETTVDVGSTGTVDLGEVWGTPELTMITMNNPGGAVDVGSVTVGSGFVIVQDLCSDTTVTAGGVCVVLIGVDTSIEVGTYNEPLVISDTGGAPIATVMLSMVKLDGFVAVSGGLSSLMRGRSEVFTPSNSSLRVNAATETRVDLELNSAEQRVVLELSPPFGETFVAGTTYSNLPGQLGNQPVIGFTGGHTSCFGFGSFTVKEATADALGQLTSFEAEFTFGCSELTPSTDFGVVRFRREPHPDPVIVGPTELDHGAVLRRKSIRRSIIANTTDTAVELGIDDSSLSPFILTGGGCPATLEAGQQCWLEYWLQPGSSPGNFARSLTVTVDGAPTVINLEGQRETIIVAYLTGESLRVPRANIAHSVDDRAALRRSPGNPQTKLDLNYRIDSQFYNRLALFAPKDLPFSVGTYELSRSGLDATLPTVSGIGQFCRDGVRSITIHSVTQVGRTVTSMSADIHLGCTNGPSSYFAVRYNTAFNSAMFVPSVQEIDFGDLFSGTRVALIRWANVGDLASAAEFVFEDPVGAYRVAENGCRGVVQPGTSCDQLVEFTGAAADYSVFEAELSAVPVHGFGSTSITMVGFDKKFHRPPSGVSGYWVLQADGTITAFGDAADHDPPQIEGKAIQIVSTPSGRGALVLGDDGKVHALGDASWRGGLRDADLSALEAGERPVTLSMTPSGWGYWIFTSRGRVFRFGDALDIGDLLAFELAADIIDSVAAPSGDGVYMIGSDGGVFALGGAEFAGSIPQVLPGVALNEPIVGIVPDPDGDGYWLVAADGGVFGFDAAFRGSLPEVLAPGTKLVASVNGMVPFGNGYLLVAADGGVFNFSDQPFDGSIGGQALDSPVVSITSFAGVPS